MTRERELDYLERIAELEMAVTVLRNALVHCHDHKTSELCEACLVLEAVKGVKV